MTVDNRADIFFNDQNVGTGSWKTQLREGNYTVETRKADCEPMLTSFTVMARQQNTVKANAAKEGNTTYGDGASSNALSVGIKLVVVPMQHLYIFAAPEYMFAMSKDNNFKSITNSSNVSGDGFSVHASKSRIPIRLK